MCTHANPITNVTTKTRISSRITSSVNSNKVRAKKQFPDDNRSFLEMSLNNIKKHCNAKNNS